MNSDFYPLVTAALKEHFPQQYNRIPLVIAWKRLWNKEYFLDFEEGP